MAHHAAMPAVLGVGLLVEVPDRIITIRMACGRLQVDAAQGGGC